MIRKLLTAVSIVFFVFAAEADLWAAHADPDTTTCYENGQVNEYYTPHPCPNQFGPDYGRGNHRWPDGSDD